MKTEAQRFWESKAHRDMWCRSGKQFAQEHQTLGSAWRACQNGCFMAYWLLNLISSTDTEDKWMVIQHLKHRAGMTYALLGGTPDKRAKFATAIRSVFNSDGSYRKRGKR